MVQDRASVAETVSSVSTNVSWTVATVAVSVPCKALSIACQAHHHCEPLQLLVRRQLRQADQEQRILQCLDAVPATWRRAKIVARL